MHDINVFASGVSKSDATPWVAIGISIVALTTTLFISFYTLRLQVVSAIQEKLTNKAKECNKYISEGTQRFPLETANVSAIVSIIISASHILTHQFSTYKFLLICLNQQKFKDLFYLELHTSISEHVHRNQIELIPDDPTLRPIIKHQLQFCHDFLELSDSKFKF